MGEDVCHYRFENARQSGHTATYYGQKKLIKLRTEVNKLYFEDGLSKRKIAAVKGVSKRFVIRWTQSLLQDVSVDHRGWPMGMRRKWTPQAEARIAKIHAEIEADPRAFYLGATAIEQQWRKHWPDESPPPIRTIGRILMELGLSRPNKKTRRGASRYLCYPEHTVYNGIGDRLMEADFVGHKFITGSSIPLNFIGFSCKHSPKFRYYKRIQSQGAEEFIRKCRYVFELIEKPHCMKVDNAAATIGSRSGKRNISKVMAFLLQNQVYPVFAVPRRPFSQASIEGNNSVFARMFWNKRTFSSPEDVDRQLEWFNQASLEYTGYHRPEEETGPRGDFVPKVYFLRQVRASTAKPDGWIEILNEAIPLPACYVNYFVFAQWHLIDESLTVCIEKEKQLHTIVSLPFKINKTSRKTFENRGALSFGI